MKILVDAAALKHVLVALLGPPHFIRELQATRGVLFPDNPITKLIADYEAGTSSEERTTRNENGI
jgi:hypothetical protein